MTKQEVIDRCNKVYEKLSDILCHIDDLKDEFRAALDAAEYLPESPSDIDDTKDEGDE